MINCELMVLFSPSFDWNSSSESQNLSLKSMMEQLAGARSTWSCVVEHSIKRLDSDFSKVNVLLWQRDFKAREYDRKGRHWTENNVRRVRKGLFLNSQLIKEKLFVLKS